MKELDNIRRDGVRRVFGEVCRRDGQTRAEIAKATGLSLMTVGKILEDLEKRSLVAQKRELGRVVGRPASRIYANRDVFFSVMDISGGLYVAYEADLTLALRPVFKMTADGGEEGLKAFFKSVSDRLQRTPATRHCGGIGVVLPLGSMPAPDGIAPERHLAIMKEGVPTAFGAEAQELAAVSQLHSSAENREGTLLYLHLERMPCMIYCRRGEIIFQSCSVGNLPEWQKLLADDSSDLPSEFAPTCRGVASFLGRLLLTCPADHVAIGGSLAGQNGLTLGALKRALAEQSGSEASSVSWVDGIADPLRGMTFVLRRHLLRRFGIG